MKILLLGGTGAMGSHLGEILSSGENEVVITSRRTSVSNEHIEYRLGDAKDIEFLKTLLKEKWDAIIDFMVYSLDEFKERVEKLLSATSQYIFLSSARVYNESEKPLTEESKRLLDSCTDDEYLQTNEYALLKARQENVLYTTDKKNWTIIRPYITYSETRLQLGTLEKETWLYRAIHGRTIVFSEDVKNHYTTLTYGWDVANAMAKLIGNKSSFGEAYHITSKEAHQWSVILNIYTDVLENELGYRPKVIYQNLPDFSTWNMSKYQITYDRLYDRKFDNAKINKVFNTEEFLHVDIGLRKCLKSFLENPRFNIIDWKQEAIKDRYTNEKTPLSEIKGLKSKIKYVLFRYILKNKQ